MFPFDGKYLKVLTPITIDGSTPLVDEETNMAQFKETHSPLSAKRYFDKQNEHLPRHLRIRYTEIDSDKQKMDAEAEKVAQSKTVAPALKASKKDADELLK